MMRPRPWLLATVLVLVPRAAIALQDPQIQRAAPTADDEAGAAGRSVSAAMRAGVFADSDHTEVFRTVGSVLGEIDTLRLGVRTAVDAVTSASSDVRSSPAFKTDAVTSASGRSSGPSMRDVRLEVSPSLGWNDGVGHAITGTGTFARELDYQSLAAGLSGSLDFAQRNTTLLLGASFASDTIWSTADKTFERSLTSTAYTVGLAQVLGRGDALRVRYDGAYLSGYMASPYRAVRFGDWSVTGSDGGALTFAGTIGSASGLAEQLPGTRLRHAGTIDWVHELWRGVGALATYRGSVDSWGLVSHTAGVEARIGAADDLQLRLGYRYYRQGPADFYREKYTQAPAAYTYYTADKELGTVTSHSGHGALEWQFARRARSGHDGTFDLAVDVSRYAYADYALLPGKTAVFTSIGWRWQW